MPRIPQELIQFISLMAREWSNIEDPNYLSLCKDWISY